MNEKKLDGILDKKEFAEVLAKDLEQAVERDYGLPVKAEPRSVMKTNGVEMQGITMHFEGSRVAPNIYVEDAFNRYQEGTPIEEIADNLSRFAYQAFRESPELPDLTIEEAREKISLTLVNTEMNREMLKKTPHFEILSGELSAVPRFYLSNEASFLVSYEACSMLGITGDEALKMGQDNINAQHFEAKPLRQVLAETMGLDEEMMDLMGPSDVPEMIVLTTEDKLQGAKALLSKEALSEVYDQVGGDFVVLPSSIHEVLCLPIRDDMDAETLKNMVREVNGTQVAPNERLSDNVFKFDGSKLTLVGDSLQMDAPKIKAPKFDDSKFKFER